MNILEILGIIFIGIVIVVFGVFIKTLFDKPLTPHQQYERLNKERYFEETGKDK